MTVPLYNVQKTSLLHGAESNANCLDGSGTAKSSWLLGGVKPADGRHWLHRGELGDWVYVSISLVSNY